MLRVWGGHQEQRWRQTNRKRDYFIQTEMVVVAVVQQGRQNHEKWLAVQTHEGVCWSGDEVESGTSLMWWRWVVPGHSIPHFTNPVLPARPATKAQLNRKKPLHEPSYSHLAGPEHCLGFVRRWWPAEVLLVSSNQQGNQSILVLLSGPIGRAGCPLTKGLGV